MAILSLVSKYSPRGRFEALVFNVRSQFGAKSFEFLDLAMTVCNVRMWFEVPKTLESSNSRSIMSLRLNRTPDLTNCGIKGPHCIFQVFLSHLLVSGGIQRHLSPLFSHKTK